MNLFGVGPLELFFIFLLVIIIFGPKDLEKTGKTIGRWLNKAVRSPEWQTLKQTGRELQNLPNRLMREANLEEISQEIGQIDQQKPAARPVGASPEPESPILPSPEPPAPRSAPEAESQPPAETDHA